MAEEHKEKMLAKKAAFEKMFKHVWGTSSTGTSRVQISAKGVDESD